MEITICYNSLFVIVVFMLLMLLFHQNVFSYIISIGRPRSQDNEIWRRARSDAPPPVGVYGAESNILIIVLFIISLRVCFIKEVDFRGGNSDCIVYSKMYAY